MRYLFVLSILLQLLLVACATQPEAVRTGLGTTAEEVAYVSARPPSHNPYLKGRGSVPDDALRQFEQAQVLIEQEDWHGALLVLQELAQSYPRLSGPSLNLALVYQQLGEAEQAGYWFAQTVTINPSNIAAYNEYGIFLRKQGRFKESESIYLQALKEWEGSAETHRDIGILYDLYLGEGDKALRHYQRYQSLVGEQDRVVAGWIVDLERQNASLGKGSQP